MPALSWTRLRAPLTRRRINEALPVALEVANSAALYRGTTQQHDEGTARFSRLSSFSCDAASLACHRPGLNSEACLEAVAERAPRVHL